MVDRTVYDADHVPELPLRQVFGQLKINGPLCKLAADTGLLTVSHFAMLGDDISSVKQTLKDMIPDHSKFGSDAPAQELALTCLAAVWKTCSTMQDHFANRRAKMEEDPSKIPEIPGADHAEFREIFVVRHPDVLLPPHREPHRKFVERVQRDFLVHGFVHFYEVGEIRTRNEQIAQKSGISKTAEDLLRVVTVEQSGPTSSESQVMDKLHAFFVALEYLNICEFSAAAGPLLYLSQLEEWRHENRGLALLLTVDTLLRKKVHRVSSDQRKKFTSFSAALLEVLTNHKQLWNDARSSAELDKFKQALQIAPSTPVSKKRARSGSRSPPKSGSKASKNKARRARAKEQLKEARSLIASRSPKGSSPKKVTRDERVPAKEWQAITAFKYQGPRRCPFFNCSLGCRFGDQCKNKHVCVECGKDHPWHGNHWSSGSRDPLGPPPGQWGNSSREHCENVAQQDLSRSLGIQSHWPDWDAVLADVPATVRSGPYFLELFAGKAGLTEAVFLQGVPVMPPVELVPSKLVTTPQDVVDVDFWALLMDLLALGIVFFLHCGTPCNTFTSARKDDGGPPPLRSLAAPMGLADLCFSDRSLVFLGNLFLIRSVEASKVVFENGGDFTIENPLLSLMWHTAVITDLISVTRAVALDLDQCAFGTPWKKPTRLLSSTDLLDKVAVRCPGHSFHEQLSGKVWDPVAQRMVFKTKGAQVYPLAMCATMAQAIKELFLDHWSHLAPSFALVTPAADRKRELGSGKPHRLHRQEATAQKALQAGYQLKRGALKPLLQIELEPGQAIEWTLKLRHPFTVMETLPQDLEKAIHAMADDPHAVVERRKALLAHWHTRAVQLLPLSVQWIQRQPDPALRRLLLGTSDPVQAQMGEVCHIALYAELLKACRSVDQDLPKFLLEGFPIVGPIAPSHPWPDYPKEQKVVEIDTALARAWDLRSEIVKRVASIQISENLKKIWDATLEDVQEGSTLGPFTSEDQITQLLDCNDWIPTQRFEVVQKNKVRGCDSATTNMINQITVISEKLQLPSTDTNVAALRKLKTLLPEEKLMGWVLDERKAYRQVAVRPDQRKFSVICLKDPSSDKPAFFVMVGHSFGLVSAVYNYNRRSAAINEFLVSIFGLVAFSFYDDKYGFETEALAPSARHTAECVHFWLGARFDQKKLQLSCSPTILGVTYNLVLMQLEIKEDRRKRIWSMKLIRSLPLVFSILVRPESWKESSCSVHPSSGARLVEPF